MTNVRAWTLFLGMALCFPVAMAAQETGNPPADTLAAPPTVTDTASAGAEAGEDPVAAARRAAETATPQPAEPPEDPSPTQEETPPVPMGDPRLIFEREVFDYPTFQRRNPFQSLLGTDEGPRFEQMRLEGIIYSDDSRLSLALLSAGRGAVRGAAGQGAVGRATRLHEGDRWGNVRVVEIRRNQVVVDVEEFGMTERRTMDLPTRGQGGSR
jgi:hypothetical protein